MEAQIKLGRIFGVEIGLHYSWLIIALLIAFSLAGHFGAAHPDWGRGVFWSMRFFTAFFFLPPSSLTNYRMRWLPDGADCLSVRSRCLRSAAWRDSKKSRRMPRPIF